MGSFSAMKLGKETKDVGFAIRRNRVWRQPRVFILGRKTHEQNMKNTYFILGYMNTYL